MGTALKSLPEVLLFRAFARDLANKIRCTLGRTVSSAMLQVASPQMKLGANRLVKNRCTLKNEYPLCAVKRRPPSTIQDQEPVHR